MEEEIDGLRAKVIASMPSSANPNSNPNPSKSPKSDEVGELSAADAAGMPTCTAQPKSTTLLEHCQTGILSNHTQNMKSVKTSLISSSSTVNVQPRTSVSQNYSKHLKRKKMPFNSIPQNLSWHGRGSDDNLVISFSDDESNSEESNPEKSVSRKDNTARANNEVPSSSMQIHPGRLQGWRNSTKPVQKKGTVYPASVSSRGTNFRHSIVSVEKDTRTPKHCPVLKMSGRQECGLVRDAHTTDHMVESLRYEIALRENKLKVQSKSTPQTYERSAGPYSNNRGPDMKLEKKVASIKRSDSIPAMGWATNFASTRKPDPVSAIGGPKSVASVGLVPNEQMTKRPKLEENFNKKLSTDGHQLLILSDVSAHEYRTQAMENNDSGTERDMGCHKGGSDASTSAAVSHEISLKEVKDGEALVAVSETIISSSANLEVPSEHENNTMLADDVSFSSDKSDRRDMAVDPPSILDQKSYFCQMAPNMHDKALRQSDNSLPTILSSESVRYSNLSRQIDTPNSFPSKVLCEHSRVRSQQIITTGGATATLETSNQTFDKCSVEFPGGKLGNDENMFFLNYASPVNISGEASMNLQSLLELEELQDKELEEAQELRRSSELEERRALKAYRKAQRDLVEANERCSLLYRKRELFSAQVRALLMDASSSICPSSWLSHQGTASEPIKAVPDSSFNLLSSLGHQFPPGQIVDQLGYESHTGCEDNAPHNTSCQQMNRQELLSGQCSEQDTGASDHRDNSALDGVHPPAHHRYTSADGDENFPVDNRSVESILACDVSNEHRGQRNACLNVETERLASGENTQNYELLEASLRSRLVARLGRGMPFKSNEVSNAGCPIQGGSKNTDIKSTFYDQQIQERDKIQTSEHGAGSFNITAETGEMPLNDCDLAIDPFWPFCMFELRGKCNNDECRFQHLKSWTMRNLKQNESGILNLPIDGQSSQSLAFGKKYDCFGYHRALSHHMLSVPTYYVGSNLIKADSHLSQSILARSVWQYWQRGFCASFSLPFSVQRILPAGAPFLQTGNDPVGDDYNWNRLSLYYETLDSRMKQFVQALPEPEQSLEMALYLFDLNVYKSHRKKALSFLSRAMEADPTSAVLWVIYLHIYYAQEKSIGKDDMFFYAVQHNEGSYELWLLYINSRIQLSDRLEAYEYALTTFCRNKNAFNKERSYSSACILDIFLQMIDFLCMSGDVEKAIQRVSKFETSGDTLLLNIRSCLTESDRCIFWFCCIYLAIYRKLPERIVQQFEFEKQLPFAVDWPPAHLTNERKDSALDLMKLAADDMALVANANHHKEDPMALRSLQFLAVSHIKCLIALEGPQSSSDLSAKYLKSYPTCIELALISARLHGNFNGDVMLRDFEESLSNWPKEVPGLQRLWNQWAKHALAYGMTDFAENIMVRWFQCFCEDKEKCDRNLEEDDIFVFLNLSIKRLLQKNVGEARLAMDKALKLASHEDYRHCVREHAAFTFANGSNCKKDASFDVVSGLLNGYMADARASPFSEPLSRKFYRNIKKPRVRHFIDNMLGPVSRDFTLMNSVLEVRYGPSLLPERLDDPKDFVDFVESLMQMAPANYRLALSVYRITGSNSQRAIKFWACALLINSIFQAVPVAPEDVWLEAALLMRDSENFDISLRFHKQAISVYPFSVKLWQSLLSLSKKMGNVDTTVEAAKERGVQFEVFD